MTQKKQLRKETVDDVFAGRTLGQLLVDGFTELADDLSTGINIGKKYSVRNVVAPTILGDFVPDEALNARTALNASQAVFAQFLGLSANAIRTWEQGRGSPNKAVRTIFRFIREDPTYWREKFQLVMAATSTLNSTKTLTPDNKSVHGTTKKRNPKSVKRTKLIGSKIRGIRARG